MVEKELDSCIPAIQKMPNEKMKMFLKREHRNEDFVNEYASIDWSQIFHPARRNKMYHIGYDFNFDLESNKVFFKNKIRPDVENEFKNELKRFNVKIKENDEDAEKKKQELDKLKEKINLFEKSEIEELELK